LRYIDLIKIGFIKTCDIYLVSGLSDCLAEVDICKDICKDLGLEIFAIQCSAIEGFRDKLELSQVLNGSETCGT